MRISKLKMGDIVLIKWTDSCSSARWWKDSEVKYWAKKGAECISAGFFFGTNKKYLTLYSDIAPGEIGSLINIPKSIITSIKLLKRSK